MASRTASILCSALLTFILLIDVHCIVEARESTFFSKFSANEYTPKTERNGVNGYQGNYETEGYGTEGYKGKYSTEGYKGKYGPEGVRDVNNGYGAESGDRVGYGSGSGTTYEEADKAYFGGSYGAYGSQNVGKEGAGVGLNEEDLTNTMPSFENTEDQQNGGAGFGNRYGSRARPYRGAGSRDELGTVYGSSTSRYEQNKEFGSGYGVRSGSNGGYDSSYNAESGYGRKFEHDVYTPGTRVYDHNSYGSKSGTAGRYEQTESGYGEFVGGGN